MTSLASVNADINAAVRSATLSYWSDFGWPVRAAGAAVLLSLPPTMAALAVSADLARPLLERVESAGFHGGVLRLMEENSHWVFLVTRPRHWRVAPGQAIQLLPESSDLRLPCGLELPNAAVWLREPQSTDDALFDGDLLLGELADIVAEWPVWHADRSAA
ncbi:hypothetical protein [Amycolatopsis speibonae]|uniref:Uncharacterized protein n=1 Tax=Amycolatopsis speibonae TaxID=1450224 RepID=A0ABV7PBI2_9PSEU